MTLKRIFFTAAALAVLTCAGDFATGKAAIRHPAPVKNSCCIPPACPPCK